VLKRFQGRLSHDIVLLDFYFLPISKGPSKVGGEEGEGGFEETPNLRAGPGRRGIVKASQARA